jgi:hypothetical protein
MKKIDVFENIARKRRRFERFRPVNSAFILVTIYSFLRFDDNIIYEVLFFISFILVTINYGYEWRFSPGTSRSNYKPTIKYKMIFIYSISLILFIELAELIVNLIKN